MQPHNRNQLMKLIELGLDHINACLELDQLALNGLWSQQQWEKELSDPLRICIGIQGSPNLVAFACGWLVLDELHVTTVAVHPHHRRKELGKLVLSKLLEKSQVNGALNATLEVNTKNIPGIALYQSCGFKTAGCRPNYYKDGGDALIQWRNLK